MNSLHPPTKCIEENLIVPHRKGKHLLSLKMAKEYKERKVNSNVPLKCEKGHESRFELKRKERTKLPKLQQIALEK